MKKAIFKSLAFLFIFVLLFLYFNDPPTGEKYITDPTRYLRPNDFVRETRGKSFVKVLPDEIPSGTVPEYRYWYYCALLGEPVYSLSLKLSKCSPEYVRAERQRMTDLDGFIKFDTADDELLAPISGEMLQQEVNVKSWPGTKTSDKHRVLKALFEHRYPDKSDRVAEIHCAAAVVMLVNNIRDRQRACGIVRGMMEIQEREDALRVRFIRFQTVSAPAAF